MATTKARTCLLVALFCLALMPIFLFQRVYSSARQHDRSQVLPQRLPKSFASSRFLNTCKYYANNPGVIRTAALKSDKWSTFGDNVVAIFITGSFFHSTRHIANLHTFLQHTSHTYTVSEKQDDDLCITGLPEVKDNLGHHTAHAPHENPQWFVAQRRWFQSLELAFNEHPNLDWYMIFDDDSFPNIPLINKALQRMDTSTPQYYLGYQDWGASGHYFNGEWVRQVMTNKDLYEKCRNIFLEGRVSSDDAFPRCNRLFVGEPLTLTPMGYEFPTSDELYYKRTFEDMVNKIMVYSTKFFNEKNLVLYEIVYEGRRDIHKYIKDSQIF
jgi:hypothetical protein